MEVIVQERPIHRVRKEFRSAVERLLEQTAVGLIPVQARVGKLPYRAESGVDVKRVAPSVCKSLSSVGAVCEEDRCNGKRQRAKRNYLLEICGMGVCYRLFQPEGEAMCVEHIIQLQSARRHIDETSYALNTAKSPG
jgi:hypothetical protein